VTQPQALDHLLLRILLARLRWRRSAGDTVIGAFAS
jgi:hypothetical protein